MSTVIIEGSIDELLDAAGVTHRAVDKEMVRTTRVIDHKRFRKRNMRKRKEPVKKSWRYFFNKNLDAPEKPDTGYYHRCQYQLERSSDFEKVLETVVSRLVNHHVNLVAYRTHEGGSHCKCNSQYKAERVSTKVLSYLYGNRCHQNHCGVGIYYVGQDVGYHENSCKYD